MAEDGDSNIIQRIRAGSDREMEEGKRKEDLKKVGMGDFLPLSFFFFLLFFSFPRWLMYFNSI